TLTSNVTTSGGAVTIDLGGGTYSNDATGFVLETTNQNLKLTAGAFSNTGATTIFKLKTGAGTAGTLSFGLGSGVRTPTRLTVGNFVYTMNGGFETFGNSAGETSLTSAGTYNFNDDTSEAKIEGTTLKLPGQQLVTGLTVGSKKRVASGSDDIAGLKESSTTAGEYSFATGDIATYDTVTDINLATGKAMEIAGVSIIANKDEYRLFDVTAFTPSTIAFSGDNSFEGGSLHAGTLTVSLTATGTITQTSGTIVVAGRLVLTSNGAISLNQTGNSLGTLGGTVGVTTGAITNNGTGGISIVNTGGDLTLGADITTSGGAVNINVGTHTYNTVGHKISVGANNVTITADDISATEGDTFVTSSGTVTIKKNNNSSWSTTAGTTTTKYYNYDSADANKKGSDITNTINGAAWVFYHSGTAPTNGILDTALTTGITKSTQNTGNAAGFVKSGNDFQWKNFVAAGSEIFAASPVALSTLSGSKAVTFNGVTTSATGLSGITITSVTFSGTNSFSGGLTLTSTGTITQ
ncbi:MAG: hypothetical protein QM523_11530, partial [Candidatus Pacebacteria bacterium]|nr:hypothetical protein [Candidatus Paceibacterota bacterium]